MRLVDADALKHEFTGNFGFENSAAYVKAIIDTAPTVDTVPVVRCKDCKWSKPATNGKGQDGYGCTKDDNPAYEAFWWLTPDWFCADGERKEE